ncbi:MAG: DNA polymerase III subunit alpha [Deltaproteobacteria bacterium]|nr:DNA polymerase III subunit alpha [Deltaproteobacteria bacterium]
MNFVHLHVHTQYSLLEGAIRIEDLMQEVPKMGMNAVAITDTHQLFGVNDFYTQATKKKIKPIIGCEVFYAPHGILANTKKEAALQFKPRVFHLVLLCKDLIGYQNLCQLLTESYKQAFLNQKEQTGFVKAYVTREPLERYSQGLIALSGCLKGELSYHILSQDEESLIESAKWLQECFKDDFYLELQDNRLPEQDLVNETLYRLGKDLSIACVATSDCHYLKSEDAEAHEVLQCIEHGRTLDLQRSKSLVPADYSFKSPSQMYAAFTKFEGAAKQTVEIAKKCQLKFKFKDDKGKTIYHLPHFKADDLDENTDLNDYLCQQARKGLVTRLHQSQFKKHRDNLNLKNNIEEQYSLRLEDELVMIGKTGFSSYFLIVADFINWAKSQGIPVGPGRGSGAGSLVAYALNITDIDPIVFNLLFERFINPERVSMPDFDIDFCQDRRSEVINYVSKKYGEQNVSQIITFGKLQPRAVVKDVGRVLGFSFSDTDQLTKLIPEELNITLKDALEKEPRLQEKIEQDVKVKKVFDYALKLEGLYRNAGIHAAGVIITEEPVVKYCPLYVGKDGILVTQFDKDSAEAIGLIKFDFLGLKTLTVIDHAVKLTGVELSQIDYSDPKVFALISSGDTDGVFQVESSGMKDLCSRIQPTSLEDLTAINALYRPGPLGSGMVDDFIDRKHGKKPIAYEAQALESILKDTYGVILYQEQVMQIARELAGYSLGQADILRRAMGKKKTEEMAENREIFVKGAVRHGLAQQKAEGIFDLMAKFAEYGFNKSHSAAYALLTYQTAWLKTHFSAEFLAALMTTEINNTDKITKYIQDAKAHQIPVLPPDINASQKSFNVEILPDGKKAIRFGLEAIKGVGGIAVESILEAKVSPFKSIFDFSKRVSTRKVNKKVLEALVLSGAFDRVTTVNRATLFNSLESLLSYAAEEQVEKELGQSSFFDSLKVEEVKLGISEEGLFKAQEDWPLAKRLSLERQVVGFYISGHPMDTWQRVCDEWLKWNTEKIILHAKSQPAPAPKSANSFEDYKYRLRKEINLAGIFSNFKEISTKKGSKMAFVRIEDLYGSVEVIFFSEAYQTHQELIRALLAEAQPVLVSGELDTREEIPKVFARDLMNLAQAHEKRVQKMILKLHLSRVASEQLRELKRHLLQYRGACELHILFFNDQAQVGIALPKTFRVRPCIEFVSFIEKLFGKDVIQFI